MDAEPQKWLFSAGGMMTATAVAVTALLWALAKYATLRLPPVAFRASIELVLKPERIIELKLRARRALGDVYALVAGATPVVILADYGGVHEAFVTNAERCSSRPPLLGRHLLGGPNDAGVICTTRWEEQRRFVLTTLKELGTGKISLESKLQAEAKALVDEISRRRDKPVDMDGVVQHATANVIGGMVLGTRFDYNDLSFASLLKSVLGRAARIRRVFIAQKIPILQKLPGDMFGYHKFVREGETHIAYFRNVIRQHADTPDKDDPRDFIDAYLAEMSRSFRNGEQTSFNEENLLYTVLQLFIAGTDTTASMLLWAWLYMLIRPDVQRKVQGEIDKCIGSRQPALSDRTVMPYTEAVLTEVMRVANVAISTIPHYTDGDVIIAGHKIRKGMTLQGSISDVHLNETAYPLPKEFDPERHVNAAGDFEKPKQFIPFGIGRRSCLGEDLARAEIFLFFTSVLQRYQLDNPEGVTAKAVGRVCLTHKPLPYSIAFTPRGTGAPQTSNSS